MATQPREPGNPFLDGVYSPVADELTVTRLPVAGTLPPELSGTYIRIGPNPVTPPDPRFHHWFLGDGMVHGVRLHGGEAQWYRNRYVRSAAVSRALGEAPVPGPRNPRADTVNTNIIAHAGKLLALVEAGAMPAELDSLLGTVAHSDLDGSLRLGGFSAHPHRDPDTGELHAICYNAGSPVVRHVVVGTDGRVRRELAIPIPDGPMIHDCALTARFVIILDLPVTFSMAAARRGASFPYCWNPERGARIGLLPREGAAEDIIWCTVDPAYVFHPCNAHDLPDGRVVIDVAAHERMFDSDCPIGPDGAALAFERWTCDPASGRVERRVIDSLAQEFPRLDERRTGKPYRYAYAVTLGLGPAAGGTGDPSALIRHDLETGARTLHDFGAGRIPGEFVFVPRSPDAAEDDGWLMGFVVHTNGDPADLVLIDARDIAAPPVAVVQLPRRVPLGFHGNWIAD